MDKKMTITRSYSRKINLGNYEVEDYFSSRSLEVPADTPVENQKAISQALFLMAAQEVGEDIGTMMKIREELDGKITSTKLKEMLELVVNGKAILLEDFLKLNNEQHSKIQDAKRAYKREQYKKAKEAV